MQQDELSQLLAEARGTAPLPSSALIDRILTDAIRLQPDGATPVRAGGMVAPAGFWRRMLGAVGGFPAMAALCSATVLGFLLGYADPTTADYLTRGFGVDTSGSVELFPTDDFLTTEG